MPTRLIDSVFVARTLIGAGVARPSRPDRVLRALAGLHRWGPTLAAGYLGAAARYPHAEAVRDELGSLSFEAIHDRTNALARGLAERGVHEGGGVAIMCRNHRGFIEASVACSKLGAHALYLNTSFAGPQVSEVVRCEEPLAIVYDQEFAHVTEQAREGRPECPTSSSATVARVRHAAPGASLTERESRTRCAHDWPVSKSRGRCVLSTHYRANATGKILKRKLAQR